MHRRGRRCPTLTVRELPHLRPMFKPDLVRVLDQSLAHLGRDLSQRADPIEDAAAAVIDDEDAETGRGVELRHDPRCVQVVHGGEIADDGDVRTLRIALAEERGELTVDPIRAAVRFDREPAGLARGDEIPFTNRQAVAEVDASAGIAVDGNASHHRQLRPRLFVEYRLDRGRALAIVAKEGVVAIARRRLHVVERFDRPELATTETGEWQKAEADDRQIAAAVVEI